MLHQFEAYVRGLQELIEYYGLPISTITTDQGPNVAGAARTLRTNILCHCLQKGAEMCVSLGKSGAAPLFAHAEWVPCIGACWFH